MSEELNVVDVWEVDSSDLDEMNFILCELGLPCPECGIAISAFAGENVEIWGPEVLEDDYGEYGVSVPNDWGEGLSDPALLFCDCPVCRWVGCLERNAISTHVDENIASKEDQEAHYWEGMSDKQRTDHINENHDHVEISNNNE